MPTVAELHYALGLSLVRQQRAAAATEALQQAASLDPDRVRFVYVYAVALNSTGKPGEAVLHVRVRAAARYGWRHTEDGVRNVCDDLRHRKSPRARRSRKPRP